MVDKKQQSSVCKNKYTLDSVRTFVSASSLISEYEYEKACPVSNEL